MNNSRSLGKVGTVGRFRPLHNGAALMLDTLCGLSEHVLIGIGSAAGTDPSTGLKIEYKYNSRNPFTPFEARDMIDLYLRDHHSNYEIIMVPDFGHIPKYSDGQMWRRYIVEHFGSLDHFIIGNDYTAELLKDDYDILHPASLIPKENQVYMRGSIVRMAMALGFDYSQFVPPVVFAYLDNNGLVERFRREFGLETLSGLGDTRWMRPEDLMEESSHARES